MEKKTEKQDKRSRMKALEELSKLNIRMPTSFDDFLRLLSRPVEKKKTWKRKTFEGLPWGEIKKELEGIPLTIKPLRLIVEYKENSWVAYIEGISDRYLYFLGL